MPRVPTYDSFQATPSTLPQTRLDGPQAFDFAGQQAQQTGQALQSLGGEAGRVALDMQTQANELRVIDALNRVKEAQLHLTYDKEAGYSNLKGINALERPDGKPLNAEYSDTLKDQMSKIADTLGNDAQKQAFALHANNILTGFVGQLKAHESQELKTYALSTSEGVQATARRDIALNWNNPEAVDKAIARIGAETYRQAQLLGKSAEWQEAAVRKMTSDGHKTAMLAALEQNDPAYAADYLKKYSAQMEADDILAVRGHITKEMDAREGVSAARAAFGAIWPRFQPSDADRAFNILLGTESGGQHFGKDGKPLTSPAGAIGIAQVMPGTAQEAAKLAGLPWDDNRYRSDPEYNKALGKAYFQKQLQDFGGDLALSYAAYNAGPGAVRKALANSQKPVMIDASADPNAPKAISWLSLLPKETQAYVAKNMHAYDAGQGVAPKPTLQEIDDKLRAEPTLATNPARYKIAREEALRLFDEQTKAVKQREEDAVATAMRGMIQNGGRWTDLPASIRGAVPPKEVDNLIAFGQKISKGDDTTNLWLYSKLTGNPATLASMSDNAFFALRRELSEADFKHFSNERAKLTGSAPGANGPGDLNSGAIKQALDARLRMLKIDPTPKDDGSADAARIGGMRQFVDQYFIAAQREAGKKFTDAEVAQHIDALFAKNATFRGWFTDTSGPVLGMKIGDIDGATKDGIKAAFKRRGVESPTDAQIMNAYWNLKFARQ